LQGSQAFNFQPLCLSVVPLSGGTASKESGVFN
jgi:hypothetical protein